MFEEMYVWADKRVSRKETEVAGIDKILERFEEVDSRKKIQTVLDERISSFIEIFGQSGSFPFRRKVLPPEVAEKEKRLNESLGQTYPVCDNFGLIFFAALLTGRSDPEDINRFNEAFCGQFVEKEDSLGKFGPLTGRKGSNLEPFSQCWKVEVELKELVEYMKQTPELPSLEQCSLLSEDETRALLLERETIRKGFKMKGYVIVTWADLWDRLSGALRENVPSLGSGGEAAGENSPVSLGLDPSLQFDVGGEKYRTIVATVEQRVLRPLQNLIGERSGALLLYKRTADNCPNAPEKDFVGQVS